MKRFLVLLGLLLTVSVEAKDWSFYAGASVGNYREFGFQFPTVDFEFSAELQELAFDRFRLIGEFQPTDKRSGSVTGFSSTVSYLRQVTNTCVTPDEKKMPCKGFVIGPAFKYQIVSVEDDVRTHLTPILTTGYQWLGGFDVLFNWHIARLNDPRALRGLELTSRIPIASGFFLTSSGGVYFIKDNEEDITHDIKFGTEIGFVFGW
jgi:hypothetical protein